ncbi:MAG TPA: hypothetical protein VMH02_02900 [Verrucomicrobiae bacterium]|nr:hypothetical protein [Verrucomicrobiae bacterium]
MRRSPVRHLYRDPHPTTSLAVPNLARLVWRLRDDTIAHSITIVHADREGEGDWALSIAAARIARKGVKVIGPEPYTVFDTVKYGIQLNARVIFAGELRRNEDARALRGAALLGVRVVGTITAGQFAEAQMMLRALGPWSDCDVELVSIALR